VKELEEHLRAALSMLTKRDTAIAALESRLAATQQETEDYRQRLAKVIHRAVTGHQRGAEMRLTKSKNEARAPKRGTAKKSARKPPRKRR
jgi:septal ring factor EnvC (AmiA/AmiB activator)